jgi:hypothetical protein
VCLLAVGAKLKGPYHKSVSTELSTQHLIGLASQLMATSEAANALDVTDVSERWGLRTYIIVTLPVKKIRLYLVR